MSSVTLFVITGALAVVAFIAWSICRAAKQMDEMFDDLDRELRDRQYRRGDR
jgi:hypothetical protein